MYSRIEGKKSIIYEKKESEFFSLSFIRIYLYNKIELFLLTFNEILICFDRIKF